MAERTVEGVERTVHRTYEWLAELSNLLGIEDRAEAYRTLRGFLHVIRDRVTVEEAAELAAQLPTLIRGMFYEGWVPAKTPERWRTRDAFVTRFAEQAGLAGPTQAAYAAAAVTRLLRHQLTQGQVEEALSMLPSEVREVLDSDLPAEAAPAS